MLEWNRIICQFLARARHWTLLRAHSIYDSYVVLFVWFEGSTRCTFDRVKVHTFQCAVCVCVFFACSFYNNAYGRNWWDVQSQCAVIKHQVSAKCGCVFRGLSLAQSLNRHCVRKEVAATLSTCLGFWAFSRQRLTNEKFTLLSPIYLKQPCPSTVTYCLSISSSLARWNEKRILQLHSALFGECTVHTWDNDYGT